MNEEQGAKPVLNKYNLFLRRKILFLLITFIILIICFILSICIGAVRISPAAILKSINNVPGYSKYSLIIFNIRLPRSLTALFAGIGLAGAGVIMQSLLRNPLGAPFTLGVSHSAAFGAAFSIMVFGTGTVSNNSSEAVTILNPYLTGISAFVFCLFTIIVIAGISRLRNAARETIILTGVALASLFTAGIMFLQYFADDIQLAAIIFWTFGDLSRVNWKELIFIIFASTGAFIYFFVNSWNYNTLELGEENARSLGVNIEFLRLTGLIISAVVTAVIITFLGVIGFIGLVSPHIVRKIIGNDYRFFIPGACITGAVILLLADTFARVIIAPNVLPVSILTAFVGVPVFIMLIIRGKKYEY